MGHACCIRILWSLELRTHLSVGISQFDCDVPLQFIFEPDSVHTRDGLHYSGLPVGHMANCACKKIRNELQKPAISCPLVLIKTNYTLACLAENNNNRMMIVLRRLHGDYTVQMTKDLKSSRSQIH